MSEAATQFRRIRDALAVGNGLSSEDAASVGAALGLALSHNIPIERALKWPVRWRTQVRIAMALDALSELRTGNGFSPDARAISINPAAMKKITKANRGKKPSKRTLERWLAKLSG